MLPSVYHSKLVLCFGHCITAWNHTRPTPPGTNPIPFFSSPHLCPSRTLIIPFSSVFSFSLYLSFSPLLPSPYFSSSSLPSFPSSSLIFLFLLILLSFISPLRYVPSLPPPFSLSFPSILQFPSFLSLFISYSSFLTLLLLLFLIYMLFLLLPSFVVFILLLFSFSSILHSSVSTPFPPFLSPLPTSYSPYLAEWYSGNALNSYSGAGRFEFRPVHRLF